MPVIKRKIIIPELKKDGYKHIQDDFCGDKKVNCRGLECKDCIFHRYNLDHFIDFFELRSCHGEITVSETKEG